MNRKHDQVRSKSALLRKPEEIVDTYELFTKKGERKVSLIGRALPNNTVSLVIYSYQDGRKVQQATGVVLLPETSQEVKNENKEKIRLQRVHVDELNTKAEKEEVGFKPTKRTRKTLASFITDVMNDKDHKESHFAASAKALINHIAGYEKNRGKKTTLLSDITDDWVRDFNDYLKFDAVDTRFKDKVAPHIKPNTQVNMLVKLSVILNEATRQGKIHYNPVGSLSKKSRPKKENENRTFLTLDEVKLLMQTPYPVKKGGEDVPNAFMFSVFSGLRFSDVKKLTGDRIYKNGGKYYIDFTTTKTATRQNLKLGKMALRFLPAKLKAGEPVFKHLPNNERTNADLKQWIEAAGITRNITFHCARHTNATLLLNSGASLATVAFQLGHKDVRMTQIYAKITNRSQEEAVDRLDKEFEKEE